ncbi:hypothetical protein [Paraburkholderia sp. RL17-347-BIC-D]|uniref:hypothetical protein n=1 Tax=Paraburkholderia sp. RL17-347-BIC-D TaxID=3031632 RepID=UPI0038B77EBB
MTAITHHHLPADLDSVGGEPELVHPDAGEDFFRRPHDAAASVRKCLEQADLVSVWRQPEWHLGRFPRNRKGDVAAMPGQAKMKFHVGLPQWRLRLRLLEARFAVEEDADVQDG